LRAVAVNFVGKFGDHTRREALREQYGSFPEYVKAAALYTSRNWPKVEKNNAKSLWSQDSELHLAISEGFKSL
jgi:hypothetical protein